MIISNQSLPAHRPRNKLQKVELGLSILRTTCILGRADGFACMHMRETCSRCFLKNSSLDQVGFAGIASNASQMKVALSCQRAFLGKRVLAPVLASNPIKATAASYAPYQILQTTHDPY